MKMNELEKSEQHHKRGRLLHCFLTSSFDLHGDCKRQRFVSDDHKHPGSGGSGVHAERSLSNRPPSQRLFNVATGGEAVLDTSSAAIGANVNEREVEGLPINGRQAFTALPASARFGQQRSGTFGDIRFSGRAVEQNIIRYDGIEGTAIIDSSPGNLNGEIPTPFRLQSSLENVQEFRVDSNNYPAEYGTGTGGQINVLTKSGTQAFHGSLFEYLRNDKLECREFLRQYYW